MDASQRTCPNCGKLMNVKSWCIIEYKLWGSYKVAKALGITQTGKQPDPSGAVYKNTGKHGKAGSPKMIPIFSQIEASADNWEAELQLNRYRIMLEGLGIMIHRLQLQVTVRDGGLAIAESRGLFRNTYRIPVRILDNRDVKSYFDYKTHNLLDALKNGWTEPCNQRECWDNIRCKEYCDVWAYCPKGMLIHSLNKEEE